jgi:hypothetical protein
MNRQIIPDVIGRKSKGERLIMKQITKTIVLLLILTATLAGCNGSGGSGSGTPNVAFVTSVSGTGNLNLWADAGGATGLAAGDAVCQARATAAGLPGTYKAWLSNSTTDAYCHVQGYDGHKISDPSGCGQSSMPKAAGPWVRTDGYPFAATIDKLVNSHQIFTAIRFTQTGTPLVGGEYFTGTSEDGTNSTFNCSNWGSGLNADHGTFGWTNGTTNDWSGYGTATCDQSLHLLCMQTGSGAPLPDMTIPPSAKKVFITSTTYDGAQVGGIAGGDAKCVLRATAVGLVNAANFKAWLSDSTHDAKDHVTQFATGPWYRLDGVKLADNKAALIAAPIFSSISYTETGVYVFDQLIWTGTDDTGSKTTNRCSDWTSNLAGNTGRAGWSSSDNYYWTNLSDQSCSGSWPLYCFEDD